MQNPQAFIVAINTSTNTSSIKGNLPLITNAIKIKSRNILEKYLQGDKGLARKELIGLYKKHPDSVVVNHLAAFILYRDKRFDEAYLQINKALSTSPKNSIMINLRGLIQRQLLLFEDAISSFQKAIKINSDYPDPYNNLGIFYRYYGKQKEAISCFKKALAINSEFYSARYNLACMKGYKFSEKEIKLVEEQQHKLKTLEDKARCSFTLYNALLKNSEHQKAFYCLEEGNQLLFNGSKLHHYKLQKSKQSNNKLH